MSSMDDFLYPKRKKSPDPGRRPLTDQQQKVYNLARNGWKPKQIANRTGLPLASVYDALHKIKHNGWEIDDDVR